jgi:dTDP-4-dehydrorhamnose 3,5-epimerase
MKLIPTELPGAVIVEPMVFGDDRGWFMESFDEALFEAGLAGLGLPPAGSFVQDNRSCSHAGVLRGLHYQLQPHAQGKLVGVVRGRAFDVTVDIRRGSPTFGRWVGVELTAENRRQLWIPPGFAHGFLALADDTHFLYETTDTYAKECERSIRWDDPAIGIDWPLAGAPRLADAEVFGPTALPLSDHRPAHTIRPNPPTRNSREAEEFTSELAPAAQRRRHTTTCMTPWPQPDVKRGGADRHCPFCP